MTDFFRRQSFEQKDIVRIEGSGNYSRIYLVSGESVLMAYTLKDVARQLPGFIRVHKTHLINPAHATDLYYERHTICYVMMGKTCIPVSKHRLSGVFLRERPTLAQLLEHLAALN